MKLILVRHGESQFNVEHRVQGWADVPLTGKGLEQADKVAARLKDVKIDAIYSSVLQRAMVTAEKIAASHNLRVIPVNDLREMNFGEMTGMLRAEADEKYDRPFEKRKNDPDYVFPDGESVNMMAERVMKVINGIVAKHPGQTVVVVAHGGVKRAIFYKLGLMSHVEAWSTKLLNTSVSEIEMTEGKAKVICFNCGKHLI
jgi:alpha-ribazole phosphatase